ncbi:hypothetical protein ACXJJ3_03120 [Kribbella sp. WER1]
MGSADRHRRWAGALAGHLAALEMTSTLPNRQYAAGAIRLGASEDQVLFGAHWALTVDGLFAGELLSRWTGSVERRCG